MSFQGVENHTDYIFYLRVPPIIHPGRSRPHYLIEVKDSKAFNLDPTRLADIKLLAMERKEFDKHVKDDPSDNWLTPETKGILSAKVLPFQPLPRLMLRRRPSRLTMFRSRKAS